MSRRFGELRDKMDPERVDRNRRDAERWMREQRYRERVCETVDLRVRSAEFATAVHATNPELVEEAGGLDPIMQFFRFVEWAGL